MISWDLQRTQEFLVRPDAASDKYSRGVLGLRTGSPAYPGAAVLGAEAAWRTGLGLLYFVTALEDTAAPQGLPSPAAAVLAARPETVCVGADADHRRVSAWVLGSGTDPAQRSFAETESLNRLLRGSVPLVLDAGALSLLASGSNSTPAAPTIITPHRGEFRVLWGHVFGEESHPPGWPEDRRSTPSQQALIDAACALAKRLSVTVLLKGSVSIAATPAGWVATSGPATPWLATAGTGDVLAGILGALIATHAEAVRRDPETLGKLGASAAFIHDTAARLAAGPGELRPIVAGDVAAALPAAITSIQRGASI